MSTMDDLEADIRNLKVLVDVTTGLMIDSDLSDHQKMVSEARRYTALMWIIRDLSEQLVVSVEACHRKMMD
ncbi:hypothetical protein MesoLj131c_46970 [Mesorhizobium sp. 131-3-5]|uniref:hypothetical protein n=1 Tax=Mesorhizobium sp. 131-3-5 TaxID=2744520 RepID=UPI0019288164|nr:hypothetical protein [Mesorhizobium sp. 131-3-5]BCH10439.1 hypothetical protein MesoLj131c_46970 [Mesorhizobium sp. 131-3-5]